MEKNTKLILALLTAGAVIGGGITLYFTYPLLAMKPAETESIPLADGQHFALRSGRGAVYFYDTGDGYIMIDAGANAGKMEKDMARLGIDAARVKWVLLTHSDYDHVAGLPLFPHADICIGEDDMLEKIFSGRETMPIDSNPAKIQLLQGGEEWLFGDVRVECIAAPGHTPGSMAFLVDDVYLFTGDALRPIFHAKDNVVHPHAIGIHPFTMDKARAEETIAALPTTDLGLILTTHYGYYNPPGYWE